nr:MAG TPA: hypothetical protein [Caudoviricetes sp.]
MGCARSTPSARSGRPILRQGLTSRPPLSMMDPSAQPKGTNHGHH